MYRYVLTVVVLVALASFHAAAEPVRRDHIEVELVAATTGVVAGETLTVALRLKPDERWHTYWKNPGDSGLATRIEWKLPPGFEAGAIQWPVPERIDVGPLANYGYHGEVLLLTDIRVAQQLPLIVPIAAKASWLVCEEICIPGDAELELLLPAGETGASAWSDDIARTRQALPAGLADAGLQALLAAGKQWDIAVPATVLGESPKLSFFAEEDGWVEYASPQLTYQRDGIVHLRFNAAEGAAQQGGQLSGVLVADTGFADGARGARISVQPTLVDSLPAIAHAAPSGNGLSLVVALVFALAGGVILNLMPCVFPVVGIKVLTFVENSRSSAASLRGHGLLFALGVLVCFWAVAGVLLALRAGGATLGWGYQLQSPLVVAALAMLFFGLALNMSGVFEFGTRLQQLAGSVRARSGYSDAFISGVIATLVATPCTAPFMGAALGYAVTQTAMVAMLVFTALGLGMAAPYLVLSFSPKLVGRLPKPGPWMVTLKQVLAFPLYLTVVWLVWVLGRQVGIDAVAIFLAGMTLCGAGAWVYGRWRNAPSARSRALAGVIAFGLVVAGALWAIPERLRPPETSLATTSGEWTAWSPEAVAAAQQDGHAVFVDFTAAWCVTCQVNKRLVLNRETVQSRFRERDVVTMVADWTNRDARISEELNALGRSGVPVYALYPPGGGAPVLLPELLTESLVLDAIDEATRSVLTAAGKR